MQPTPRTITRSDPERVEIEWSDGHATVYSARDLRLLCPCALCVDELTSRPLLDPASVAQDITQADFHLVGSYAVSMRFSDGHNTGIYPFRMLRENDPAAP